MTKKNPVKYAENDLGVHQPWEEAQNRLSLYGIASDAIAEHKRELRTLKAQIEDAKHNVRTVAPSEVDFWDSMSQKDRDQAIKDKIADSDYITELEKRVREHQASLDTAESEARHHELGLKVLSSRMTELGGLLSFYAEVKRAETDAPVYIHEVSPQVDGSTSPTQTTGE